MFIAREEVKDEDLIAAASDPHAFANTIGSHSNLGGEK